MSNENNFEEFDYILKKISEYTITKQRIISTLFCVLIVSAIVFSGYYTVCKCYCSACVEKKLSDPDSIDLKFNSEVNNFKYDFSVESINNSNVRSDCFWFIIFFNVLILLVILFYFISYSSKEKRVLQGFLDIKELNIKNRKEILQTLLDKNNLNLKERKELFQLVLNSEKGANEQKKKI